MSALKKMMTSQPFVKSSGSLSYSGSQARFIGRCSVAGTLHAPAVLARDALPLFLYSVRPVANALHAPAVPACGTLTLLPCPARAIDGTLYNPPPHPPTPISQRPILQTQPRGPFKRPAATKNPLKARSHPPRLLQCLLQCVFNALSVSANDFNRWLFVGSKEAIP